MATLQEAIRQTSELRLVGLIISHELRLDEFAELFSAADLDNFKNQVLGKIKDLAAQDELTRKANFSSYLHLWKIWGDENEPRDWIQQLLNQPRGPLTFLCAFILRGEKVSHINKSIGDYCDLDQLNNLINAIPEDDMTADEERAVNAWNEAWDRGDFTPVRGARRQVTEQAMNSAPPLLI